MTDRELVSIALDAMKNAYAPYSRCLVGAALLCDDGSVFSGCNVENASFGATNCAERTAVFKAVSEGKRKFTAVAVVGGKNGNVIETFPPCGICRQVLSEFAAKDMRVILFDGEKVYTHNFFDMLPFSFTIDNVK